MYKSFYNLNRNPFEITPDPKFLFPTTRHNEALASLYYGVRSNRGFVVLTGEVGTGKTLILRSLLGLLQQREVAFALIFNPTLSPMEFIRYIARDFGLAVADKPKDELIHLLNGFLLQRHEKKLTTILVVDEAHHLSMEILEEIRLLTNLETSQQKLLQIVLAGQPELDAKLDSYELRQLKQRVALRCHLEPLTLAETGAYVNQRLKIAGAIGPNHIFTSHAIEAVFGYSQGIPRIINTICENALLAGYAKHAATITSEIIDDVARDLRLGVQAVEPRHTEFDVSMEEQHRDVLQAVKTLLDMRDRMHEKDTKRRLQ
ncbi:MAG: AAA family ATPase [Terriglobales bacterium]|jgi:general secretion pathway protein A